MPRRAAAALMAVIFTVPAPGGPPQPQMNSDPAAIAIRIRLPGMIHRVPIIVGDGRGSSLAVER